MVLSLFLPLWVRYTPPTPTTPEWAPVYPCVFDPLDVAGSSGPLGLQVLGAALVAAAAVTLRGSPRWAWGPAVVWLFGCVFLFWKLAWRDVVFLPTMAPVPHPTPWAWTAAVVGGACVLLASANYGPPSRTDVTAFD
jgi:hypothetical protein